MITQIDDASYISDYFNLDIDLKIKRDDLYPCPGGGIKARKMEYILKDVLDNSCDVLVTNGGPQSNHARAAALMTASIGMKCHLVIVLEPGRSYPLTGNILLMKLAGAKIEYCRKDQLSERMDSAITYYKKRGKKPAYIWGGGHCHAGTVAFVEAGEEAKSQCGDWEPDYLLIASGTGTTQAGLHVSYLNNKTNVIGISVARDSERGESIIKKAVYDYYKKNRKICSDVKIRFMDDWVCGGYEKTNSKLLNCVNMAAKVGLILDPTYSGKCFYGLVDLVKRGDIKKNSKVLFWHSGGLMNLMGSELANCSIDSVVI